MIYIITIFLIIVSIYAYKKAFVDSKETPKKTSTPTEDDVKNIRIATDNLQKLSDPAGYYFEKACDAYRNDDYNQAIDFLNFGLNIKDPHWAKALLLKRSDAKSELGNYSGCLEDILYAEKLIDELDDSDIFEIQEKKAYAYHYLKDYKNALNNYDQIIAKKPKFWRHYINRGLVKLAFSDKIGAYSDWESVQNLGKGEKVADLINKHFPNGKPQNEMAFLNSIAELMGQDGTDKDFIESGYGEFGLEVTNPIPTKGVVGSNEYLSNLLTADNKEVRFERKGSVSSSNINNLIDEYNIYNSSNKLIGNIYLAPYNKKNSNKLPIGFKSKKDKTTKVALRPHMEVKRIVQEKFDEFFIPVKNILTPLIKERVDNYDEIVSHQLQIFFLIALDEGDEFKKDFPREFGFVISTMNEPLEEFKHFLNTATNSYKLHDLASYDINRHLCDHFETTYKKMYPRGKYWVIDKYLVF